jgi:hypothetical protein
MLVQLSRARGMSKRCCVVARYTVHFLRLADVRAITIHAHHSSPWSNLPRHLRLSTIKLHLSFFILLFFFPPEGAPTPQCLCPCTSDPIIRVSLGSLLLPGVGSSSCYISVQVSRVRGTGGRSCVVARGFVSFYLRICVPYPYHHISGRYRAIRSHEFHNLESSTQPDCVNARSSGVQSSTLRACARFSLVINSLSSLHCLCVSSPFVILCN